MAAHNRVHPPFPPQVSEGWYPGKMLKGKSKHEERVGKEQAELAEAQSAVAAQEAEVARTQAEAAAASAQLQELMAKVCASKGTRVCMPLTRAGGACQPAKRPCYHMWQCLTVQRRLSQHCAYHWYCSAVAWYCTNTLAALVRVQAFQSEALWACTQVNTLSPSS